MVHLVSARRLAAVHETVSTGPTPWRWCLGVLGAKQRRRRGRRGSRPTPPRHPWPPDGNLRSPSVRPPEPGGPLPRSWGIALRGSPGHRLALVALMPQWRQDHPNNRPPTRATAISAVGQKPPPALQKTGDLGCVIVVCGFDGTSFRAMMGPAARAQNAPASRQLFNPI